MCKRRHGNALDPFFKRDKNSNIDGTCERGLTCIECIVRDYNTIINYTLSNFISE